MSDKSCGNCIQCEKYTSQGKEHMYDELVKRLRELPHLLFVQFHGHEDVVYQAADAIEELTGFVQKAERDMDECRERLDKANDTVEELSKRVDDSIPKSDAEIIIAEVAKPKWIPVTERLPEDREMVIGYTPCDGFMFVGYHVTFVYHDRDFSYWNIVTAMRSTRKMMKKVTHWMPLPQPSMEE